MPNITKDLLRALRDDVNTALVEIGRRHGVTIHAGNAKFNPESAVFKLSVTTNSPTGEAQSQEALDFKKHCAMFHLRPEDLGKHFIDSIHGEFEIVGLKPKSYRFPILCKSMRTGQRHKFPVHTIHRHLGITGGGR